MTYKTLAFYVKTPWEYLAKSIKLHHSIIKRGAVWNAVITIPNYTVSFYFYNFSFYYEIDDIRNVKARIEPYNEWKVPDIKLETLKRDEIHLINLNETLKRPEGYRHSSRNRSLKR